MKLRRKTLSIVGITIAGLTGILYATSSNILLAGLIKAEEQEATQVVKGSAIGDKLRLNCICQSVILLKKNCFFRSGNSRFERE